MGGAGPSMDPFRVYDVDSPYPMDPHFGGTIGSIQFEHVQVPASSAGSLPETSSYIVDTWSLKYVTHTWARK